MRGYTVKDAENSEVSSVPSVFSVVRINFPLYAWRYPLGERSNWYRANRNLSGGTKAPLHLGEGMIKTR